MKLRRNAGTSIRALFAHRVRAMLAASSVSVGTAAVLVTSAIGTGADRDVRRGIASLGVNLVIVRPAQVERTTARREVSGASKTLTLADFDAIASLPKVGRAAPGIDGGVTVKLGTRTVPTQIVGTSPAFPIVRRFDLRSGRFFDDDDDQLARRVVVLGARVADQLDDPEVVGKQVRIRGIPFEVIGVLAPKGVVVDGDEDDQVVIPIRTALRRLFNATWLTAVYVSATDAGVVPMTESAIGELLARRHPPRDGRATEFEIQDASRYFAMQRKLTGALQSLTAGLSAVALGVGGTAIMALMLLSVRERTSEIGLRVAVGATPTDIVLQFLLESLILALGGWVIGLTLGGVVAFGIKLALGWHVALPAPAIASSFGVSVATGLGFGAIPARRASRVRPIQALVAA